jgi:hypothetical protein
MAKRGRKPEHRRWGRPPECSDLSERPIPADVLRGYADVVFLNCADAAKEKGELESFMANQAIGRRAAFRRLKRLRDLLRK